MALSTVVHTRQSRLSEVQFVHLPVKVAEEEEEVVKAAVVGPGLPLAALVHGHQGVIDSLDGSEIGIRFAALISPKEGFPTLQDDTRQPCGKKKDAVQVIKRGGRTRLGGGEDDAREKMFRHHHLIQVK